MGAGSDGGWANCYWRFFVSCQGPSAALRVILIDQEEISRMGLFKLPGQILKRSSQKLRQHAESKLEDMGVRGELSENDVDGLLAPIYESLVELERTEAKGPVKQLVTKGLRRAVGELELLLLPERQEAFTLLGVRRDTDGGDIKRRFRALALQHHPDRTGGDDSMMRNLNQAYSQVKRIKGME